MEAVSIGWIDRNRGKTRWYEFYPNVKQNTYWKW